MRGSFPLYFGALTLAAFGYAAFYFHPSVHAALSFIQSPASVAYIGTPVSVADLYADYHAPTAGKVRVLIVPGHEPTYGGAEFAGVYERELVVGIAQDLQIFLSSQTKYTVLTTRDSTAWNPIFANYFVQNQDAIAAWEATARQSAASLGLDTLPLVDHVAVPTDVALRLYGITKWADENTIDVTLHLHLNDHVGHSYTTPGSYSGLAIYVPAQQFDNSTTTKAVATSMLKRLSLYTPVSDLPEESGGIIDDPQLIAVGANNTAGSASMLIEYDYIYQPQFTNPAVRSLALKDLAYQTYLGLQDFFTQHTPTTMTDGYAPSTLYPWTTPVTGKGSDPKDIYALQTALLMDGDFPPAGKTPYDCPHSGTLGPCTRAALAAFQQKNGITGERVGGQQTFTLLQNIYWER